MRAAMALLAAACLVLGSLPTFVIPSLNRVTSSLFGVDIANQLAPPLFTGNAGAYQALISLGGGLFGQLPVNGLVLIASPNFDTITAPSYLLLMELLLVGLVVLALRLIPSRGKRVRGPVWAGGIPAFTSQMQYTPTAYANPIRIIFDLIFRSRVRYEASAPIARHREGRIAYSQIIPPPLDRELYQPVLATVRWIASRAQAIQSGNVNQYVAYIFLLVLAILVLGAV